MFCSDDSQCGQEQATDHNSPFSPIPPHLYFTVTLFCWKDVVFRPRDPNDFCSPPFFPKSYIFFPFSFWSSSWLIARLLTWAVIQCNPRFPLAASRLRIGLISGFIFLLASLRQILTSFFFWPGMRTSDRRTCGEVLHTRLRVKARSQGTLRHVHFRT
jgi:hypothetical protein